ncbi:hypothetical protein [Candidatus Chlorohelix sp.]|uniref:ATP-binding protein n=1 Tax=Candidatus Chlorohelix sp. TaxID=3139201 RepID=UPI0030732A7D
MSNLIERDKELEVIRRIAVAQGQARLLLILGESGSGKSALLNKARADGYFGDYRYFGASIHNIEDLLDEIARAKYAHIAMWAREVDFKVEAAQVELTLPDLNVPNPFEPRLRAVQAIPPEALHYLIRKLYNSYDMLGLSADTALFVKTGLEHLLQLNATNLNQLRTFVSHNLKPNLSEDAWELYLRPDETLAGTLGKMLAAKGQNVLLDNYRDFDSARLLSQIISNGELFWSLVVEDEPAWVSSLPSNVKVERITLSQLSQKGFDIYLEQSALVKPDSDEALRLYKLAQGLPLTLGMLAKLQSKGIPLVNLEAAAARTPGNSLEGIFLYFVEESGLLTEPQKSALYALALLRHLQPDFVEDFAIRAETAGFPITSETLTQLDNEYPWLWDNSANADSLWKPLHPSLKAPLQKWLMVEKQRFSRPVQEGVIEPARNAIAMRLSAREHHLVNQSDDNGSLSTRARDPEWGELVLDMAYYRWLLDEAVGWLFAISRALMALAYNPSLAQRFYEMGMSISYSFYTEGRELLPCLRALLADNYTLTSPRSIFEEKLKALDVLESLTTTERGRWFKQENLGLRQGGKGSGEAEIRGILRWLQGLVQEQAAQYDRAASLYESVLSTNVEMPELKKVAARSGLYMALRYRLKGAKESALSALQRTIELDSSLEQAHRILLWQGITMNRPDVILEAVQGLGKTEDSDQLLDLYSAFALWLQGRLPEALSAARAFKGQAGQQYFNRLIGFAELETNPEGLEQILAQLP